jgi:hypothetical protein
MKRFAVLLSLWALAACGTRDDAKPGTNAGDAIPLGRYQTDTLAAPDASGRVITLELKKDSHALLTSARTGQPTVTQQGRFHADGPNLQVEFPGASDSSTMTFRWRLVSSRLVPVDWDRSRYGPAGLTLHLR